MVRIFYFIFIALLALPVLCSAQIYRYIDENGVPCFTDNIDKVPEDQRPGVGSGEDGGNLPLAGGGRGAKGRKTRKGGVIDRLSDNLLSIAGKGDVESVKNLLERRADVGARDEQGQTPLMKAAKHGNYPVAKLLIDYGADVNASDQLGGTALKYAKEFRQSALVGLLKRHGAKE